MENKNSESPFEELRSFFFAYLQQEISRPLKALAQWAFLGLLGSLLIAIGSIFFTIGGIRVLQNETGSIFEDSFSWAPYLLAVGGVLFLLMVGLKFLKTKTKN